MFLNYIHPSLYPQLSLRFFITSPSQLHVLLIFIYSFILSTKSDKHCPYLDRLRSSIGEQGTYQWTCHQREVDPPSNYQLPIFMLEFLFMIFFKKNMFLCVSVCWHVHVCIDSRLQEARGIRFFYHQPQLDLCMVVSNLPSMMEIKLRSKSSRWS